MTQQQQTPQQVIEQLQHQQMVLKSQLFDAGSANQQLQQQSEQMTKVLQQIVGMFNIQPTEGQDNISYDAILAQLQEYVPLVPDAQDVVYEPEEA